MNRNICRSLNCPQHNLTCTHYCSKSIKGKLSLFSEIKVYKYKIYTSCFVKVFPYFVSDMVNNKLKMGHPMFVS